MRKVTIWDVIITIVMLAVVCVSLVPAVARLQRTPEDSTCQANMRRWAGAMQLYLADWDGCYPTNRNKPGFALTSQAFLSSQDGATDPNKPNRFVNSISWVEALYPYLIGEAQKTGRNWQSVLKCPRASSAKYPPSSPTACVSYVFNYNLLEQSSGVIRDKSKLMMMREFDRLMESCCRPVNNSTGSSSVAPQSPFLTKTDNLIRGTTMNYKMHCEGSYIVFADGHVKYFSFDYFPNAATTATVLNAADSWDPETQQWWNWVNKNPALDKAIAVTP